MLSSLCTEHEILLESNESRAVSFSISFSSVSEVSPHRMPLDDFRVVRTVNVTLEDENHATAVLLRLGSAWLLVGL